MAKEDLFLLKMTKAMANKDAGYDPKNPNRTPKKATSAPKKTAVRRTAKKSK